MEKANTIIKDQLKEKLILFAVGVLVGAVISAGAFYVYIELSGIGATGGGQSMQIPGGGTPPEMSNDGQGGTPPEMPNGNQGDALPEESNDENESEAPSSSTQSGTLKGEDDSANTENQDNQNNASRSKSKNKVQSTGA